MSQDADMNTRIGFGLKRTFHRTVIHACPNCHAPGRYSSIQSVKDNWSGCYVPPGDKRDGQNIMEGDCPHCGYPRPKPVELPVMEFTE